MMLLLKTILKEAEISQSELAQALGVSGATVAQIVNHDQWPKRPPVAEIKRQIIEFLEVRGVDPQEESCFAPTAIGNEAPLKKADCSRKETDMLLRKHSLTQPARRLFNLVRDPFDEVRSGDEVFMTPDSRYVREALRSTARHGGFIAVVGESGAGKSTLRRDLVDWINKGSQPIVVIEPYVLGMEDNDIKGKTLKSSHIAEAVMAAIAPREHIKRSPEARFRQVHEALRESHRAGNRHVLVIEEAHGLPIPTLKHLKRFFELEDGFSKLLGIVLIGQSELAQKLDERNPNVREVVQRCELVTLNPLGAELEGYLKHRFELANKPLAEVMDSPAIEALRSKLTGREHSVLYPLAVHNVMAAAMNLAVDLGMPAVTAELIREV
jgi:type II secretory pathway predicted ATPase ExeA/DNA-binding XRE family transcriptional regulator